MSMLASHVQIASLDYIDSAPQRQYATVKRPEAVCENALFLGRPLRSCGQRRMPYSLSSGRGPG